MSEYSEPIVQITDGEEACPKCQKVERLEIGLTFTGCYGCGNNSLAEQKARAKAYQKRAADLLGEVKYLEQERKLDNFAPYELRDLLDLERARLSALSTDGARSYTGYDSSTVSFGIGHQVEAARSNIRQAIDTAAVELWGKDWVTQILASGNNSWLEDPNAAPGMNDWSGPVEVIWDEQGGKPKYILPVHSERDDLVFLGGSGPITDEYYANEDEEE